MSVLKEFPCFSKLNLISSRYEETEKSCLQVHSTDHCITVTIAAKWEMDAPNSGHPLEGHYKSHDSRLRARIPGEQGNARRCEHFFRATFSSSENDQCKFCPQ